MSKNRSKSPVTGLRKLSKDPKEAAVIRGRIAKELRGLRKDSDGEIDTIIVPTNSNLTYDYAGALHSITPAQLKIYALELVKKDILLDVAPHGSGSLAFQLSRQGRIMLDANSIRLTEAPRAVYTIEVKTRQAPLLPDKATTTTIVKPTAAAKRQKLSKPKTTDPAKTVNIDISRAIRDIRSIEAQKLIITWENAHRILDRGKKVDRRQVQAALNKIEAEWSRRNSSGLPSEYFKWPTIEVRQSHGNMELADTKTEGLLSKMNYHVGVSQGLPELSRRRILAKIFETPLSVDIPVAEKKLWGKENTGIRLRKIAYTIAALVRNAKRRDRTALEVAIKEWEADLRFLYDNYYVNRFDFPWPSTLST